MGKQAIRSGRSIFSKLRKGGLGGWLFTAVVVAMLCGSLWAQSGSQGQAAGGGNAAAGSAGSDGQASSNGANSGQGTANAPGATDNGTQAPSDNSTQAPTDNTQAPSNNGIQAPADSSTQSTDAESNGSHASRTQGRTTQTPAANGSAHTNGKTTPPVIEAEHDGPQEVRQPVPYANLPSLQDLYTQIPSSGGTLRRFGSEAFLLGTGNANELPSDLPVGPDYVLGPGDNVVVNMWGGHSEHLSVTIDRQGQIALPESGTITVDGLTIAQAQAAIQKSLGTQFQDEHVEISLGRLRTVRVYVVGDVQRPGAYDVSSLSTPLSVLYAAGGPTSRGSLRILKQYRGTKLVAQIDLYDFLLKGVRATVERLLPGDTIMVPSAGPEVTIEGMVHHPAIYELNGEKTLNQVLDLAGGVLSTASLKQINVARVEAHERRTMLSLDLPSSADGVKSALAGFNVQGGDDVVISQILPYNQQAIYLEGHVFRPGRYPYHDGMTITDLLRSYQDVLPEPADHAEIVRLQAPDYRPETIGFNLPDVLLGNNPIKLQPFDVIRIFGRYGIDSPRVTIDGQVLRPGTYPMSEGMTVAGLVRMAGGFNRSAFRDTAGLSSYVIENGQKVLVNHSLVEIQKALDGDKQADVLLKPGDVVSIQQLAGWVDIGSSVQINGEVEHPGAYGIEQGERLSTVLKRAGGLREYAYPQAARFERVQVQQLGEQAREALIRRIESTPIEVKQGPGSTQDQQSTASSIEAQRDQILAQLRNQPASGRMVISISPDISQWENTPADIELRAGDVFSIPKRPNFVIISGEVYNPTAISFVPGKDVKWYLQKGGGPTSSGDKKRIFVLRADGSVVAHGSGWTGSSVMDIRMRPGDTIIVPEKILGGSDVWKDIIAIAQITSSIALTAIVAGAY